MNKRASIAPSRWLSPPQVAKQLGIDAAKVIRWIRAGELRAIDVAARRGGRPRWRISTADLEAFLRFRQSPAPVAAPTRQKRRMDSKITQYF
jgi:excisionase family DNA binding protein